MKVNSTRTGSKFTWNIAEKVFTEVPLCLSFVTIKVVFRPSGLLMTAKR